MRAIAAALGLVLAAAAAGGQSPAGPPLTVQYLEGRVWQRVGNAWEPVSIGDTVPLSASLKVDRLGLVQLQAPGASLTLTQPGTYSMAAVMVQRAALRATGAVDAAAAAFAQAITSRGRMVNAAGGARAEQVPVPGPGAPSDPGPPPEPAPPPDAAHAAINQADDLIAGQRYEDAIGVLRSALGQASGNEARQLSFYLASASELNGDPRGALAALKASAPRGTDDWAADSVLLGARLLEDTFAWAAARDLLVKAKAALAIDQQRAQGYYFLLALAYRGTGERARQKAALGTVIAFDPESDLAIAAAKLKEAP